MSPTEPSDNPAPEVLARREIRVFISSTFRDMQRERELLVKKVFPELRRICDERFVTFTEVDLRWGITEEEASEGKVLPICLEEIKNCRPHFIGILGERYGWIPHTVPPEVLEKESWIEEHVGSGTSVTELEILHGVLRNPEMAGHAFFYFRDPAFAASPTLSADEQAEMLERDIPEDIEEFGPEEAARRTQHRKDRLAALKETVRKRELPLIDPYADPEELAAAVRQQFLELIDQLYPKEDVPDPLDQEAIGHRTYARRKLLGCIERPTHLAELDAFVASPSTGQGLVITGDSGGGKTALLAAFVSSFSPEPTSMVFEHYFGATSESASVPAFLHRLLGELKRRGDIPDEIPSEPEKMVEVLPLWLAQTAGKIPRIVLMLDALNQIEGEASHRNLSWLPRFFPDHVRVIASSLSGPALDTLRDRDWATHALPLADADERGRMIDAYLLDLYHKTLSPALRGQIINAPGAANPLFLRTVLEELRQFGDFEYLPDKVGEYLEAATPIELFQQVLRRWQVDFPADRNVVNRSLRHLWAARQGLSESEWLDLLADDHGDMDRQTWRPLFLALTTHLVQRSGLWALGHDYLKQAIEIELLPTADAKQQAHLAVAEYFEKQPATPRACIELPFQLARAGSRDRLRSCLLDIERFLLIQDRNEDELRGYWIEPLREQQSMGQAYYDSFESWSQGPDRLESKISYAANQIGTFLATAAIYEEAEQLLRRALAIEELCLGEGHPEVAVRLNNLAEVLRSTNRPAEAESLMRRALAIREASLGEKHHDVALSLSNLAALLREVNQLGEAEFLMQRALVIDESVFGRDHPNVAIRLNNLAGLLQHTNRLAESEPLYRRSLSIWEQSLGQHHPNVATGLANLASLLQETGRFADAEPLLHRSLAINEQNFGSEHPAIAITLNNLAALLKETNRLPEAERLSRRALAIDERIFGSTHPNVASDISNLVMVLQAANSHTETEPLMRRALAIHEKSFGPNHPDVATDLNNLALLLHHGKRYDEAEPLMRRALVILEHTFGEDHPNVASSLNNVASLLLATGRLAEAEPLMLRHLEIFLKITRTTGHPHPHVKAAVINYSTLLKEMGRGPAEIHEMVGAVARRYGFDLKAEKGSRGIAPSRKLERVIEQVTKNPSQARQISALLEQEDPALFKELIAFTQSQKSEPIQNGKEDPLPPTTSPSAKLDSAIDGGTQSGERSSHPEEKRDQQVAPSCQPMSDYLFAIPVPGKPGFVFNPYTNGVVNVEGIPSGTLCMDPTDPDPGHKFRVP